MRTISELNIYPIKSCQGQSMKEFQVFKDGPEGDRQWMLIDENGDFITQRKYPKLATVQVLWNEQGLSLGLGKQFFVVPKTNSMQRKISATIWKDQVEVALEPDLFSQALSQYLGVNVRLVRCAPYTMREPGVRFPDSLPLLLLNTQSLQELNSRLDSPVGMERFRGNIVFEGAAAYEEDTWSRIRIGEVTFSKPKKSARCTVITIDQKTGTNTGPEPLKTLAGYRRDGKDVQFGVLWIPENAGLVRLGDSLEIMN